MSSFVVTGIGTEIGKTYCSAFLCKSLGFDYWKPIQAGELDNLDSDFVRKQAPNSFIYPERKLLKNALSPHAAAEIENISLNLTDFELPDFFGPTLIEGAGGIMVPINSEGLTYLSVFKHWNLPIKVVTKHYLGSINHTLLTLEVLIFNQLTIDTLIINGERNEASEKIYRQRFPKLKIAYIPLNALSDLK